ncbi:MAG: D-tyrosyl-tRNA(Tyr) deacylase [Sulfuritalea sp.]|nr:D-tyrosyl-tRNA(Tyr) deacylase [Sulfuritalea sp.]
MQALVQRVLRASVRVDGVTVAQMEAGLLLLLCAEHGDTHTTADKLLQKVLKLRIFSDAQGKMNLSLQDLQNSSAPAGLLIVSQFTLAADTSGGNRPSFKNAADPIEGRKLYDYFVQQAKGIHGQVQTGVFAADMQVELVNDGPVTLPMRMV